MSAALGLSARDVAPLVARFIPECTTNGLSVIAMSADHSETMAGAFGTTRKRLPGRPAFWNASASPIGTSASRVERCSSDRTPHTDVILLERESEQHQTGARIF